MPDRCVNVPCQRTIVSLELSFVGITYKRVPLYLLPLSAESLSQMNVLVDGCSFRPSLQKVVMILP